MPRSRSTLSLSRTCWFDPLSFLVIVPVNCSKVKICTGASIIQNYTSSSLAVLSKLSDYMRDRSVHVPIRQSRLPVVLQRNVSEQNTDTIHERLTYVGYNGEIPVDHMNIVPVKVVTSSRT